MAIVSIVVFVPGLTEAICQSEIVVGPASAAAGMIMDGDRLTNPLAAGGR